MEVELPVIEPSPSHQNGTSGDRQVNGDVKHMVDVVVDEKEVPTDSHHSHLVLPVSERAEFSFENLSLVVKDKNKKEKKILDSIYGIVRPGEVCAVMGPSGSGKTSLLDMLTNRIKSGTRTGTVMINGVDITTFKYRHVIKYVPQEDLLFGTMTVRETLEFSAELFIDENTPKSAKQDRIEDVASELGLATCINTKIGTIFQKGISGGQKRRVSIAVELFSLPKVLILDEPTSGLDSASALRVVEILKKLANTGRAVICTIHQPSSEVYHHLDKVMLLSGGKMVYFGPSKQVVPYFAALGHQCPEFTNPSDFLLEVVNTDFDGDKQGEEEVKRLTDVFAASKDYSAMKAEIAEKKGKAVPPPKGEHDYKVSLLKQFVELTKRAWKDNLRNPGIFWVRIAMYTMLSLMIGLVYLRMGNGQTEVNDRTGILFYIAAFMVFMSISAIPAFITERAVFVRERANGWYNVGAYVLANTLCSMPGIFLIALVSSAIIYPMVGFNSISGRFGLFLLDLFLSLLVAESFMLVISSVVPFYIIGMALAAGVFGMFMLCEGFFVVPDNIPPYFIWAYYIAFHTYSFEMFMWTEFDGLSIKCDEPVAYALNTLTNATEPICRFNKGEDVLALFDMEDVNVSHDIAILVGMTVIYRFLFYYILSRFHKGQR